MTQDFSNCYHGGAFFAALGPDFATLQRRQHIINADVLDAWFDPSPRVVAALQEELPWLLRTSPPTHSEGLLRVLAQSRDVPTSHLLAGAGSSDLIFLALREWLTRSSRVFVLDPTYGEYTHLLETVIQCRVERFPLQREHNYRVDLAAWARAIHQGNFDLVVLVNPNSPTGQHLPRAALQEVLLRIPARTRVWVDETYVDYAGVGESLERFATTTANVVVCKSMSKVYALSGVRCAYLCGAEKLIRELRPLQPPWAVSLPAQLAAVRALQDLDYYTARWQETQTLRQKLAADLSQLPGWKIISGVANFVLCHLPESGPTATRISQQCQSHGLFLRDISNMGVCLGQHALRIAVKDAPTNQRIHAILQAVCGANRQPPQSNAASGHNSILAREAQHGQ